MSRQYKPTNINKDNISNIINNLKLDSLDEIGNLNDTDINFLIDTITHKKNDLNTLIHNTETLYNRKLNHYEIRNIKITFLFEHLLNKMTYNSIPNTNIPLEQNTIDQSNNIYYNSKPTKNRFNKTHRLYKF